MKKLDNSEFKIEQYFRNRYLIAEYRGEDEDDLINIWDNMKDFCEYFHISKLNNGYRFLYHYLTQNKRFYLIDLLNIGQDCFEDSDVDTIRTMFPCP